MPIKTTLHAAQARAAAQNAPYAGLLLPDEAATLLQHLPHSHLVDVRTRAEWQFVGGVPRSIQIEWKSFPNMQANPHFLAQLEQQVDIEHPVFFLCRTGGRSHEAAALAAIHGYHQAYNILEGFEGDRNEQGHRGTVTGWKARGLSWTQS